MPIKIQIGKAKKSNAYKEFSKKAVIWVLVYIFLIATGFLLFCCYEMHRLQDLSPISDIAPAIFGALTIIVSATVSTYMWRAKQKDAIQFDMERTHKLSQAKTK